MQYISELPKILRYHGIRKTAKAKEMGLSHQTFGLKLLQPAKITVQEIIDLCDNTPEIGFTPIEMFRFVENELNTIKSLSSNEAESI